MTTRTSGFDDSSSGLAAAGVSAFAGFMLAIVGLFQALQGLAAIGQDDIFVDGVAYTYELDVSTWGWIHLALGVLAFVVAIGFLMGAAWGRYAGIVLAVLGCLASFLFLPYYPWWSLAILLFNVAVVWALSTQLSRDMNP
ncbi:DUF7144 family membrane protein [Aeromicrobium massiliense]|uniref:DUF7144 family membrane protein n=1 Tax=Aeromicrobium massiliense TaxID=1464554 RepID=UPI0002ED6B96|nr:hypothetical protein [Aeromicrobium massiliense]